MSSRPFPEIATARAHAARTAAIANRRRNQPRLAPGCADAAAVINGTWPVSPSRAPGRRTRFASLSEQATGPMLMGWGEPETELRGRRLDSPGPPIVHCEANHVPSSGSIVLYLHPSCQADWCAQPERPAPRTIGLTVLAVNCAGDLKLPAPGCPADATARVRVRPPASPG